MIKGLSYIPNYIDNSTEAQLIQIIDQQNWLGDLKRRVQHYGYKYDYKARKIDQSMHLGALPDWLQKIALQLHQQGHFTVIPDQVIINEYTAGQGISAHIDCEPCFTDTIASISLGSGCQMDFTHIDTKQKYSVFLEPGSIVILKDESLYKWMHAIPGRKSDTHQDKVYQRSRRLSLTFRKVII